MNEEKRFWEKVDKRGPNDCWLWTGSKNRGYGQMSSKHGKSPIKAHQFSYVLHFGEIKNGLEVCHDCDNPSCVNPKHLFLGTHQQNMEDATKKGRLGTSLGSILALHPGQKGMIGAGSKSLKQITGER